MSEDRFDLVMSAIAEMRGDIQQELRFMQGEARDRFDRLEVKTDAIAREVERILTRLSAIEISGLSGQLSVATLQARLNDYGVRLELIEKRLELKDKI